MGGDSHSQGVFSEWYPFYDAAQDGVVIAGLLQGRDGRMGRTYSSSIQVDYNDLLSGEVSEFTTQNGSRYDVKPRDINMRKARDHLRARLVRRYCVGSCPDFVPVATFDEMSGFLPDMDTVSGFGFFKADPGVINRHNDRKDFSAYQKDCDVFLKKKETILYRLRDLFGFAVELPPEVPSRFKLGQERELYVGGFWPKAYGAEIDTRSVVAYCDSGSQSYVLIQGDKLKLVQFNGRPGQGAVSAICAVAKSHGFFEPVTDYAANSVDPFLGPC